MLEFHNSDFILDVMTVPVIIRLGVWSPYNADKGKDTNLGLLHNEELKVTTVLRIHPLICFRGIITSCFWLLRFDSYLVCYHFG